jgi:hypothetical protein
MLHLLLALRLRNLSRSVQWTCLANETVEVAITNNEYTRLIQSDHRLSLWHPSCHPEINGTHTVWQFSDGECGSKTANGNGYKTITNVVGICAFPCM